MKKLIKTQDGFSTLEILIAFAILTIALTSVILVTFGNQSTSIDSQTNNEALTKARQQLEIMRALARQDFGAVKNCDDSSVTKCSDPVDPFYSVRAMVNEVDSFTKQIASEVTYSVNLSRPQKVELNTIVTDWSSVLGGDTCNPTLSGNWATPQLLGTADIGSNNAGTDVDVIAKKAYITANSSTASKHDFYVIDVTDPNLPNLPILGSINTGPGLATIHVVGNYAYVANISTVTQLQVIDISSPGIPVLVASLDVTLAGDTAVGNSIFYSNKKIYLGLSKSTGPEFHVIDVSNPLSPAKKASFETNTQVGAIILKNNVAFLAVPDDPLSIAPEQLRILDVSQANSGIISQINTFSHPNAITMSGAGLYISIDGDTLYLGRAGLNSAHNPEFFSLNITIPNNVTPINSKYTGSSVNAIIIRDDLAFIATGDTNLDFQIWDLNNLGSGTPYGSKNIDPISPGGIDCEDNTIYVVQKNQKAFQIVGPGL